MSLTAVSNTVSVRNPPTHNLYIEPSSLGAYILYGRPQVWWCKAPYEPNFHSEISFNGRIRKRIVRARTREIFVIHAAMFDNATTRAWKNSP